MACDPSQKLKRDSEERYAWERSCGFRPHEAARRAGLNARTGVSTKYEAKTKIQARIAYLRRDDLSDEVREEKRRHLEERLETVAFGDILLECAIIDPITKKPVIDWEKVIASGLSVAINEFSFDADTGHMTRFKRDDALAAAAQLRDMRGFKAPARMSFTVRNADQMSDDELSRIAAGGSADAAAAPGGP